MFLRLAHLGVTNALAMLRLLPMTDRAKDAEILALRHQLTVLERQLHGQPIRFTPVDRALLTALLHPLPRDVLRRVRLLVRPDTVLRWHRNLITRRHAAICRPQRPGRLRTVRPIRVLALRLARENSTWGYRRIHGELLTLGIKVAASTMWEILKDAGIDPAPDRTSENWATFLRSQTEAILPADFFETVTLTGPGCTCWPSSSTPPAGYASSAPPLTRPPPGSPRPQGIWRWICRMLAAAPGS